MIRRLFDFNIQGVCRFLGSLALLYSGFSTPIFGVIGPALWRLLDPDIKGGCRFSRLFNPNIRRVRRVSAFGPSVHGFSTPILRAVAIFRHFGAALQRLLDPNCSGRLLLFGLGPASQWLYDPNSQGTPFFGIMAPLCSGSSTPIPQLGPAGSDFSSSIFRALPFFRIGLALQWLLDPNMQGVCRFGSSTLPATAFPHRFQGICRVASGPW
eukprot:gene14830-biopygen4070